MLISPANNKPRGFKVIVQINSCKSWKTCHIICQNYKSSGNPQWCKSSRPPLGFYECCGLSSFSLCLLLLKLSTTTYLSPLWNSFLYQNPLSPLLYPSHNLKRIFFKEPKVLLLTQKISFRWELYSRWFGVLRRATHCNRNLTVGKKWWEKVIRHELLHFLVWGTKKVIFCHITGVLCMYPPSLICTSCTHIKTVPANITGKTSRTNLCIHFKDTRCYSRVFFSSWTIGTRREFRGNT